MSIEKLKIIAEEVISASQAFTDTVAKALEDAYNLGKEETHEHKD